METISCCRRRQPSELTLAPNLLGVGWLRASHEDYFSKGQLLRRNQPSVIRPIHHVKQRSTNHRLALRRQLLVRQSGDPS
jgi:hypothetical protein